MHLGYLGYDPNRQTAFVPNEEIRQELVSAVESTHWNEWISFQQESELRPCNRLPQRDAILF